MLYLIITIIYNNGNTLVIVIVLVTVVVLHALAFEEWAEKRDLQRAEIQPEHPDLPTNPTGSFLI